MPVVPLKGLAAVALLLAATASCSHTAQGAQVDTGQAQRDTRKIRVVTTISTLNSFVQGVGGEFVTVKNIVPVGASPETFAPAPQDVASVADANVLVENGAGLESWLDRLLHDAGSQSLHIVVCSEGLPVKNDNPHLWMDPVMAKAYVAKIRDTLAAVDPPHAQAYRRNAAAYNVRLDELTATIRRKIGTIPPSRRNMIVFHNAWQYYNDRFGIVTLVVERNPGQEPNPQQIAELIDLAKRLKVRAVFSEPEYSPKILYTIAQGSGIKVVENLYDDSVGTDPRVSTYPAMLLYDTNVIVAALK
ncbi:MAG TPA: metal ABC transporter substrate-binding protein [Candidatus Baltobacteraceae bacterium]|nr:metal ABC transporter substrate-binding protein [Candidatus Baltobacteraceae bacterium]